MKRVIIVLLALFAAVNVSAQDLRFGVAGGLNLSWEKEKVVGEKYLSDSYVGFQVGVKAEMDFADKITDGFYLEGSLLYSLKGSNNAGIHTNMGFIHIPINLLYRMPISDSVSLMGGLGPYLSLGVLGKDVETVNGSKVKTDVFGSVYQRFDFGLNYKIGVEMWNQWQFYAGFEHGLLDLTKTKVDDALINKCHLLNFYIGTAYMF